MLLSALKCSLGQLLLGRAQWDFTQAKAVWEPVLFFFFTISKGFNAIERLLVWCTLCDYNNLQKQKNLII